MGPAGRFWQERMWGRLRQIERKGTSLRGPARQPYFPSQQARQLATDRKSQAGACILSAGSSLGLLKCLKDDLVLFRRYSDTGIFDGECDNGVGTAQSLVIRAPSRCCSVHLDTNLTFIREFKCIREQVFEDLLEPLAVRYDGRRHITADVHLERELLLLGKMSKTFLDKI